MKKYILIAGIMLLALAPAAEARTAPWIAVKDAKSYARWYWEDKRGLTIPCYAVGVRWEPMGSNSLGYTTRRCLIHLNSREPRWGWYKLCWAVIHEYGHIVGYGHTSKPNALMRPAWNGYHDLACGSAPL
jgi:Matrixin